MKFFGQFFAVTALFLVPLLALAEHFTEGVRVEPTTKHLKSGEYIWEPERAPEGPLLIVTSIPDQEVSVYRNGIRIARSSVSTGRPGHPTPTGVFTILEKEKHHVSSIYKGAEMPYMERVTWGGIALHAGSLPGYPDSHGCVRLPLDFSKLLYGVTLKGATVIIADDKSAPLSTVHPGLFFSRAPNPDGTAPLSPGGYDWNPDKSPTGPVAIILSSADKRVYIYRNGVEIGRAHLAGSVDSRRHHVYSALNGLDADGHLRWVEVTATSQSTDDKSFFTGAQRVLPPDLIDKVRAIVVPGTTLIFTDQPVNSDTQSKPNFPILYTEK